MIWKEIYGYFNSRLLVHQKEHHICCNQASYLVLQKKKYCKTEANISFTTPKDVRYCLMVSQFEIVRSDDTNVFILQII